MVDFKTGWEYISRDFGNSIKESVLILIAGIIPVVNFAVAGHYLNLIKNSAEGQEEMPSMFNNLGGKIIEGLKMVVFMIILMLPVILLNLISFFPLIRGLLSFFSGILGFIGIIVYMIVLPPLVINYAVERNLSALFSFGKAFRMIKKDLKNYIMLLLFNFVYSLLGAVPVVGTGLSLLAQSKIMGTWYAESTGGMSTTSTRRKSPTPPPPPGMQ